jgi:hypothetical protein
VLLSGADIARLSKELERQGSVAELTLLLSDMGEPPLESIAPTGSLYERAYAVILYVQRARPPRTRELLQALQGRNNAALRAVATELLTPTYFSPTADPLDATLIGRAAFVNRRDLRDCMRNFATHAAGASHLLVVRGARPCGKSYTWQYLRHLAVSSAGALPQRVQLAKGPFTPRSLVEHVALLLDLSLAGLPPLADDPQLARIDSLIAWFKGKVATLATPYWLVIDDLNDERVEPAVRDTAYALAFAVEEIKPANLWVVLLGYNEALSDPELRYVEQEQAQFPTEADVSAHLEALAASVQQPLEPGFASALAARLCQPVTSLVADAPPADVKAAMLAVTINVEKASEKIREGVAL